MIFVAMIDTGRMWRVDRACAGHPHQSDDDTPRDKAAPCPEAYCSSVGDQKLKFAPALKLRPTSPA
jgi:hypothetical protein